MQRPGRGSACLHSAAFCTSALSAISAGDGRYRCPICSSLFTDADIVPDVALLLFIAEHPSASACTVVRRGGAASDSGWAYRKAPKHAQAKRPRTMPCSDAAPVQAELPAAIARGSGSSAGEAWGGAARPIKLETAAGREAAPAIRPAARVPKFERALPLQPVATPAAAPAAAEATPRGSAAAMAAASVRRHAEAHASALPSGAASASAAAAAAVERPYDRPHSAWGCGGAAPPRGCHGCPAAFGSSKSAAPSEHPAHDATESARQARKAQQRRARREAAKRTELLAKVKDALIRRALHEDHPEDRGGVIVGVT
eukprot:CAMPEP_0119077620 /NCGR_PEP_ID=MMETSP1178-20130426/95585_1 /TAXON_ID=33656 /ORGANISM="unid sp, Strain CCMP2000" /LENGTH=313 /DNA_ID=CAMNT_0007059991 /DNA_START=128 /DNA_END=1064 /DNA_ORIENTATION=-